MDVFREQGETCHLQLMVYYRTTQRSSKHPINNVADVCLGPDLGGPEQDFVYFFRIALILRNAKTLGLTFRSGAPNAHSKCPFLPSPPPALPISSGGPWGLCGDKMPLDTRDFILVLGMRGILSLCSFL